MTTRSDRYSRKINELNMLSWPAMVLLLIQVLPAPPASAAEKTTNKPEHGPVNYSNVDCMAIGDWNSREECFSKSDDYENCPDIELRCSPYKKMYAARKELETLETHINLLVDQLYGGIEMWDRAYLVDLKESFKDANEAWADYRDKECLSEQFIAGTTRGNEMGNLIEACRLEMTNERIQKLKRSLQTLVSMETSHGQ